MRVTMPLATVLYMSLLDAHTNNPGYRAHIQGETLTPAWNW